MTEHKFCVFTFADVEVREREFSVVKDGKVLAVEPKAFRVLLFLLRNPRKLIKKDELLDAVWNDVSVSENSLTRSVAQLRRVLGDDTRDPHYIATVPTVGYRFLCDVEVKEDGFAPLDVSTPNGHGTESGVATQSAEEMQSYLMSILDSLKTATSRPRILIAIAGAVVVVAAFAVVWWLQRRPAVPAEIKEQQLTRNATDNPITSVTVSPDGKYFAYSDLGGLHVKLLQTEEVRDFPQPAELGKARVQWLIAWLPDSTRFLAVAWGLGVPSTWQVSVVSGSLRILRKDAVTWSVSPDGTQFAFTDANEQVMWLMNIGGDRPRKVADAGAKNWFSYVEWSPDGSHLLYLKRVPAANNVLSSMEVRDLKSGSTTTLLSSNTLRSVYWLHDGRILYVESDPGTNGDTCRNWITRLDNTSARFAAKPRQLAQGNGFCISSSSATADGKHLYFLKQTSEFSVYVADLAPDATRISPPKHLTLTEDREFPAAWTADSREIVLVSNRGGKWGFYRQSLSSDTATPVLTGVATRGLGAIFPRVTPDGTWLVYAPYPIDYVPGTPMDILKVPISGGVPQLVMKAAVYDTPRCARAPATLCAVATKNNDHLIFTGFDPARGAGHELARLKIDDPDKDYTWDLSPDGTRIVTLKRGTSEIHVFSLRTHAEQKIIVKGWDGLAALDWTSDGKGLFASSLATGSVLLHTDLHGNASVLWEPKGDSMTWAVSSPDGRHVAMPGFALSSNVWSMENF
jgi:DNA-binding winged helix-turn-helix (wHTH) protein/Tol biopolymer transport system component